MSISISQITPQVSTISNKGKPPVNQSIHALGNILRIKDFKISGSISSDKGHISLGNLNKQIERGLAKGYAERDVIEGLIRAFFPALHLKSYLESKKQLSLVELRTSCRVIIVKKYQPKLTKSLAILYRKKMNLL